jgi:DNA-binding beta-propeller fold protein YncE
MGNVLDVAQQPTKLALKSTIPLPGQPEGYALDDTRGLFYTNLEDKDRTLVIDTKSHKIVSTWTPGCGDAGPRGLSVDGPRGQLFVACTDHVVTLDTAHQGAIVGTLDTGGGVDNIDFHSSRRRLYVAAGKAARLTVAQVGDSGSLTPIATAPIGPGSRVVVVDNVGKAYVADSAGGQLLSVSVP